MDTTSLLHQTPDGLELLVPSTGNKDHRHRLHHFALWLRRTARHWSMPDLEAYREYLLQDYQGRDGVPLAPNSVRAHLSTVRGRYRRLLRDNRVRQMLFDVTPSDASASDRKAFVDEILTRMENAIDPALSSVEVITRQDVADDDGLRLSVAQATELLSRPGQDTLLGLRDTAVIALLLGTGIREAELCQLNVPDLQRRYGGEPSLQVRRGKGAKERLIPYGDFIWAFKHVERWLRVAGIEDGAVFRGFYRNAKSLRKTRITGRAINYILDRYPIDVDGRQRVVHPHDLRRTYARLLYDAGVDLLAIRDNLGHADTRTTLRYIGNLSAAARRPPKIFD